MADVPNDTRHCPLGVRCESCGTENPRLAVRVVPVLAEVMCVTLCPGSAANGPPQ